MSHEGRENQEEGREWGGRGRSRQGSSGQAGDVSLWRGPDWLGAALVGFSFKHHDSGLGSGEEKKKEKQHKTGLGLFSSSRERSSRPSHLQGPPQNAFASSLQGDFPRSLCGQIVPFYRGEY